MPALDERKQNTVNLRCSYEVCETCLLFRYCETCYNETCLFEECNQFCGRCPVTCHSNPDPHFEEVDLAKLQVARSTAAFNFKCAWFPTIRKNPLLKKIHLEVVAVKFEEVYNFKSGLMRALDLHDYFELPLKTKIILTFNIPDKILEKIWLIFLQKSFKLIIKGLKVDYICSPNFSNFFDTPRYQYWRNIWRSIKMTNELIELGHNVIFDVSSPVPATHRYYIKLIKRSRINSLVFNCQTTKLNRYKQLVYERFKFFNSLDNKIPFIITGLTSKAESLPIYKALPNRLIYFTSTSPYLKAICQHTLSTHRKVNQSPLELLRIYFAMMQKLHEGLRNETRYGCKKINKI